MKKRRLQRKIKCKRIGKINEKGEHKNKINMEKGNVKKEKVETHKIYIKARI